MHAKKHKNLKTDSSDVILRCGEKEFRAHHRVLVHNSVYFQKLFIDRKGKLSMIVLYEVNETIFQYVFDYMYEGDVNVPFDNAVAFCNLLERFCMEIPTGIPSEISSQIPPEIQPEIQHEIQPDIPSDIKSKLPNEISEETPNEYDKELIDESIGLFVQTATHLLQDLNVINMQEKSEKLLKNLSNEKMDTVIGIILQTVSRPLFNHISLQAAAELMLTLANQEPLIKDKLRSTSMKLFHGTINNKLSMPPNYIKSNRISSFDKLVNVIENVDYHLTFERSYRLAHFIGHLFLIDLVEAKDIYEILILCNPRKYHLTNSLAIIFHHIYPIITRNKGKPIEFSALSDTEYENLWTTVHRTKSIWTAIDKTENCCDAVTQMEHIFSNDAYHNVQSSVEHLFWSRHAVSFDFLRNFIAFLKLIFV